MTKNPEDDWYLNVEPKKANRETGEGYVHEHDGYGVHPVTRKHRKRKFKAVRKGKFVSFYYGRKFIFGASFKTEEQAKKSAEKFNKMSEMGKRGILDYVHYCLFEEKHGEA